MWTERRAVRSNGGSSPRTKRLTLNDLAPVANEIKEGLTMKERIAQSLMDPSLFLHWRRSFPVPVFAMTTGVRSHHSGGIW
jgi:hypothetical protein